MTESATHAKRFSVDLNAVDALGVNVVYVVTGKGEHGAGFWKVGESRGVLSRLVQLELGLPFEVEIAMLYGAKHEEHRTVAEGNLLGHLMGWNTRGEWHHVPADEMPLFVYRLARFFNNAQIVRGPAFPRVEAALASSEMAWDRWMHASTAHEMKRRSDLGLAPGMPETFATIPLKPCCAFKHACSAAERRNRGFFDD